MNTLITITNLNVEVDNKKIINNLSFELKNEEILTIIGKSGVGKSTILKCILNLIEYEGSINTKGRAISYMPQDLALFDFKTVYDNVALPFKIVNKEVDELKINLILEDLEILNLKNSKVETLSGGQKSRVALARALILQDKVLLLDEPLAKLDYLTKHNILQVLKRIKEKYKISLIYVTHDIEEVLMLSDRILILNSDLEVVDNNSLTKEDLVNKLIGER